MLLIRKKILFLLMLISATIVIFISITAYLEISRLGNVFIAERFLFNGILLLLAMLAVFSFLFFKSKNIKKELDSIIKTKGINKQSTLNLFKRLGTTGKRLSDLFLQFEAISEKRKDRIICQKSLIDSLLMQTNKPLLVINLKRKIEYISKGMLDKLKLHKADLLDKDVSTITGKIQIKPVLSNLEKTHIAVKTKNRGNVYEWIPIYNEKNEITYIIILQI